MNFNSNTIKIPTYNDGYFDLYEIKQFGTFPVDYLQLIEKHFAFEEQSIGDKLKFELKQLKVDIVYKIIIPQEKSINSKNVLEINGEFFHVANSYHFTDNDGFDKTRLSLEHYDLRGV